MRGAILLGMMALAAVSVRAQTPMDPSQAARIGLARVARDQGRTQEAFEHFREASGRHPFELAVAIEYFWVAARADVATAERLASDILRKQPGNNAVRDAFIGILAHAGREQALRDTAADGARRAPALALWPRRLAESYLRTRDGARAAEYYARAAARAGGTTTDRAMRALALEIAGDKTAALRAWNDLGKVVWSSQPEWSASRSRAVAAMRAVSPPPSAKLSNPGTVASSEIVHPIVDPTEHSNTAATSIEAAISGGNFKTALALAQERASVVGAPVLVREQYGVLLHWTGDDARAEPVLRAVVAESGTPRAIDALIEVLRANQHTEDAWTLAARRSDAADASTLHRMMTAMLSLETGRVSDALARASALQGDPQVGPRARTIVARALVDLGRPAEARAVLGTAPEDRDAALAWLEATAAIDGKVAALRAATPFTHHTGPGWNELTIKRAQWQAAIHQRAEADRVVAALDSVDPQMATIARAELALAEGKAVDAATHLLSLVNDVRVMWRAKDLLSIALAEHGRWAEAHALLTQLRERRPNDMMLTLRDALWRHRQMPSRSTLRGLETIVEQNPAIGQGPLVLARALLEAGEHQRALSVLAADSSGSVESRLLRARIEVAQGDLDAANAGFHQLVSGESSDPDWYLAWADMHRDASRVREVIAVGAARFPDSPLLLERMAQAAWAEGDRAQALRSAERALGVDGSRTSAWFVLVAAAQGQPDRVAELAQRFELQFATAPSVLLNMADLLSTIATSPADAALSRALEWTTRLHGRGQIGASIFATRARLFARLDRRDEALSELQAGLAREPAQPALSKLRAELLMQFGDHAGAIAAYDEYLALVPADVAARRQQARIEGWRGSTESALARYQLIRALTPDTPIVAAEMAAKRAYFEGRWQDAVGHYDRWLTLEPAESEAQFERAQALDHLGDTDRAADAYRSLQDKHAMASAALGGLRRRQAPSVDVFAVSSSADAEARRQLFSIMDAGAGYSTVLGGLVTSRIYGGRSFAAAGVQSWKGTLTGAEVAMTNASPLNVSAGLAYRALSGAPGLWFGDARMTWKAQRELRATVGIEKIGIFENAYTVATGLSGFGPAARLRWNPRPALTVDLQISRLSLDDRNVKRTIRADVAHSIVRERHGLRLLASTEQLAYADSRETYFTPDGFWRHDVGAEWRWWVKTPRFFGDRERWISAAYLYGADNRDVRYRTVRADATYEFSKGMGLVANAQLARSAVYNSTRATIGLRFTREPAPLP